MASSLPLTGSNFKLRPSNVLTPTTPITPPKQAASVAAPYHLTSRSQHNPSLTPLPILKLQIHRIRYGPSTNPVNNIPTRYGVARTSIHSNVFQAGFTNRAPHHNISLKATQQTLIAAVRLKSQPQASASKTQPVLRPARSKIAVSRQQSVWLRLKRRFGFI
jgi:hypothetical protein